MNVSYSVILPAYNEEKTINRAINETLAAFEVFGVPFEIIVVDDGSHDQTVALVREKQASHPNLLLIKSAENTGKGGAIKKGVEAATGDLLLFMDCDLATHPSQFAGFIPHLREHPVVIGSRRIEGSEITIAQPLYRSLLGELFNTIIRRYLGIRSSDTQCGFKAFQTPVAKELFENLQTKGWTFDVELLLKADRTGYSIKELPVQWRNGRDSKVSLSDGWRILKELHTLKKNHK